MRYEPGRCLLRQLLKERHLSQRWLHEQTNILESNLSDYINNRKTMGATTMKTIAMKIKVPMDALYEWNEVESK